MPLGLYRVCFEMGTRAEGAPLLYFDGLVNAPTGHITGQAMITQAVAPPGVDIHITNVKGHLKQFNVEPYVRLVNLEGTFWQSFTPPAIGEIERKFAAVFFIERDSWTGMGSFEYGLNEVTEAKVTSCEPSGD
jgi:hypothetical protein